MEKIKEQATTFAGRCPVMGFSIKIWQYVARDNYCLFEINLVV